MISFWEKQSLLTYDYIIIGSGIVGLSVAANLKEQKPTASVLILERGIFPTGASTKNAGFACIGSLSELLADLDKMPTEGVIDLVNKRLSGLRKLRTRLGDKNIGYKALGSYELLSATEMESLAKMGKVNQLLFPILGKNAFTTVPHLIAPFGFSEVWVKGMIENRFEGQLDTGKLMKTFLQYVTSLGVTIITGANVLDIVETATNVQVNVYHTQLKETIYFTAQQVAVCTNAFTKKLLPKFALDIVPGRGQVVITQPIANLPFQGIFHFDQGYYYFRTHENRIIFGGGRNLDFEKETSTAFEFNKHIINDLKQKLTEVILPNRTVAIDMKWAGIMAFGQQDKMPIIKKVGHRVALGVRLGGMGIAIGSLVGEEVAQLLLNK